MARDGARRAERLAQRRGHGLSDPRASVEEDGFSESLGDALTACDVVDGLDLQDPAGEEDDAGSAEPDGAER